MIKIKFDDTFLDDNAIMSLSQDYKMFDNSFMLGGTPCRAVTLEIYKDYFSTVPEIVRIYEDNNIYATLHVDNCELIDKTKYKLELSDAMTLLNSNYDASEVVASGEATLDDILVDILTKFNLTCDTETFYGSDKVITWYDNQRTARDYIGYIAELNGGYAVINKNGNLEFKLFSNTETNEININECEDLTLGEYHKITKVVYDAGVLKWEYGTEDNNTLYINTDNVYITEQEDIEHIYNTINNFEFYSLSTGNCPNSNGNIGETINFIDGVNTYPTILQISRNYNGVWIGGYTLDVNTEKQEETQIIGTETKIKNIYSKINRDEAQLEIVSRETTNISDNLNNNYYTKDVTNELILNSKTGITNTFSEAGGNNIFRNTGLWFENTGNDSDINPYEYWNGVVTRNSNDRSVSKNSMLLQNGTLYQESEVPNGNYAISFWYKKLNPLATASVKINDIEYDLDSEEWEQFYTGKKDENEEYIIQPIQVSTGHLRIDFICDKNNGVEVYDLMANKGTVKLAWSQNQNETTTDTVNISKGITITSTEKDVKFRANADGIRVYKKNASDTDEPITDFTDKGTSTKELTVEKQAKITGILINEIDDQTWITRM